MSNKNIIYLECYINRANCCDFLWDLDTTDIVLSSFEPMEEKEGLLHVKFGFQRKKYNLSGIKDLQQMMLNNSSSITINEKYDE